MLKSKHIDKIAIGAMILALLLTLLLTHGERFGIEKTHHTPEYVNKLFVGDYVHTINLEVDDWESFIDEAMMKEYVDADITIDGHTIEGVGLRTKGSNSLTQINKYDLSRYSLKVEFDHFAEGQTFYGLDKISLDASFQDNSYMKSHLAYDMMRSMGVKAPLTSYSWVTINEEPWGLFLIVEEPEEAFVKRNYGLDHGQLYKPSYRSLNAPNRDIALQYLGENANRYSNIFDNAKFDIDEGDKNRLIASLKQLDENEDLESAINIDRVLNYFVVQAFVLNMDNYLGWTTHNYFLYEEEGVLEMIPWDYNLAFGTYNLGSSRPIRDPNTLINYPILTPAPMDVLTQRPLFYQLINNPVYRALYLDGFERFTKTYPFEIEIRETHELIAPYVKEDPTAFSSYEDYELAIETLIELVTLRKSSVEKQLDETIPATHVGQSETEFTGVDASHLEIRHLGDFDDLENAKSKQDLALQNVLNN